jgi:radical SAM superfamily enzyme YgiQ (UPF0313 family)
MAKVLFIQDIVYEYFGVMYMSAYLKDNGHDCDVLVEFAEKNWVEALERYNPDLIAFSVLTGSYKWALSKAAFLKEKYNTPIVFGGVHVFLNPDKTIQEDAVDIICTGEGEIPLKELCDSIDKGKLDDNTKGFWFKMADGTIKKNPASKLIEDLDSLPFADRQIYWKYPSIAKRTIIPMLGSRGCPYVCSYCFIPAAKKVFAGQGKFIRERSPQNILDEVEHCLKLSPHRQMIHFVEDHFGNNRAVALEVLRGVSKMKNGTMQWGGAIRIERVNNEEYVRELSKTNHGLFGIAVECGDEKYRKEVLKRDVKNQEIIEAAALARKYGIRVITMNMLGLPGETFEQAVQTLEFNIKLKPVYALSYVYQPYPGTDLQRYAVEHKLFDQSISDNLGISFYDRYLKNDKQHNQVINLQRVFGLAVTVPILKKPLIYMAKNNWRIAVDIIFSVYYMWWLLAFYKITFTQVYNFITLWLRNKFSESYQPAVSSIRGGEGQLYPSIKR